MRTLLLTIRRAANSDRLQQGMVAFSIKTTKQLEKPGLDINGASIIVPYTKHHALYVLKQSKSYSISSLSSLIKIIFLYFIEGLFSSLEISKDLEEV